MLERTIRTTAVSARETIGTLSFLLNTRARLATSIYAITFTTRVCMCVYVCVCVCGDIVLGGGSGLRRKL